MSLSPSSAKEIISALNMQPHPEGGWYKETWREERDDDQRASGTAIYYLLEEGQASHWHKVDAVEIWHWYAGAPIELRLSENGTHSDTFILGQNVLENQKPQVIVPKEHWQSARSLGKFTLVGCTVSPGFEFSGFKLAPPDWSPAQ